MATALKKNGNKETTIGKRPFVPTASDAPAQKAGATTSPSYF